MALARRGITFLAVLLLTALASVTLAGAGVAATLEDYFGVYVGMAEVSDVGEGVVERRHMDIEIGPYQQRGFRIRWVNVTLVDGRRDLPGVERRVAEVAFEPKGQGGLFIEARAVNPFARSEEAAPIAGDPVRWAKLDDAGLHVFSFVVLPDGRYEMQSYTRRLTDDGLVLVFERVVDGTTLRRIDGRTVRAQ